MRCLRSRGKCSCSDPNNESDPSSEYSPLGLTHVMNQYLGQKFTTWVKINCLDTILKPRNGIPRPCTVHEYLILLEMQHTDSIHAFKMADKIARQEGHRVEYLNELLFCLMKTSQKLLLPQYSPLKIKILFLTN